MVSIHRPLGYGPSTLPLRHSAHLFESNAVKNVDDGLFESLEPGRTHISAAYMLDFGTRIANRCVLTMRCTCHLVC